MSDSVRPHRRRPTRLPRLWDSPGKNTGVGCHFLLQCVKVKVKSLSRVRLLATPWTAAYQAAPSIEFSRQEYWSGVPLLSRIKKTNKQTKTVAHLVNNWPELQETRVRLLGWHDPRKGEGNHSTILAGKFHGRHSTWGHK